MIHENDFDSVDEQRRQDFEKAWVEGNVPRIDDFLPPNDHHRFLGTLEELVHIDLEFRWKLRFTECRDEPPKVETYLKRFPVLKESVIFDRLLKAEIDLRRRYGNEPSMDELATRFPEYETAEGDFQTLAQPDSVDRNVQTGDLLGRYRIIAEQGKGGFGTVWRADDDKLGRRIALKQLSQQLARQSESRRQFVNEARVTARLEHPGIVPVYDISNLNENHAYYTMKLVRGETLAEAIAQFHSMKPHSDEWSIEFQRLLASFMSVCQTIDYCHSRNVIHRDLKPQNIVIAKYGETIVLDWGLARILDRPLVPTTGTTTQDESEISLEDTPQTLQGSLKGTPAYMSPEQAQGEIDQVDTKTDIYALGVILYQLLTGQAPFQGKTLPEILDKVIAGEKKKPRMLSPLIPRRLEAICLKAMHRDPQSRYENAGKLTADLQRFVADEPIEAMQDPLSTRVFRWVRKHKTLVSSMAVAGVLILSGLITAAIVRQNLKRQEANRLADLRASVSNAETGANVQIQAGAFGAAERLLAQASHLADGEPILQVESKHLQVKLDRVQQIARFYELSRQGQHRTFFDDLSGSSIHCQEALRTIGVFENSNWWAHLPDQDLPPMEKEKLREEIYRILLLVTAMRLGETSTGMVRHDFLQQKGVNPNDSRIASARYTARLANMFRPATSMKIAERYTGNKLSALFLGNINPLNPTDAAAMGSVLDNNLPRDTAGRLVVAGMLGGRDPAQLAKTWLNEAISRSPDWYWIPVFVGVNQLYRGDDPESALLSFSHAIGVRPDSWVGYEYRALTQIKLANREKNQIRKADLLRSAALDIERAKDMEPNSSYLLWTDGFLLFETPGALDLALDAFMEAMLVHPRMDQIEGGHFSGVTRKFLVNTIDAAGRAFQQDQENSKALLVLAAAYLWQNDLAAAEKHVAELKKLNPDHAAGNAIHAIIQLRNDATNSTALRNLLASIKNGASFWHSHFMLGTAYESKGELSLAKKAFQNAFASARSDWQAAHALIAICRCQLLLNEMAAAVDSFRQAISIDLAVDVSSLAKTLEEAESQPLADELANFFQKTSPLSDEINQLAIVDPPLLNGDFELGVSFHWGNVAPQGAYRIWVNNGNFESTARVSDENPHAGRYSLLIDANSNGSDSDFGTMSQQFQVTKGKRYEVSVWCRTQDVSEDSLFIGVDSQTEPIVSVLGGDQPWTHGQGQFTATSDTEVLSIIMKGRGKAWVDDIVIYAVDDSPKGALDE